MRCHVVVVFFDHFHEDVTEQAQTGRGESGDQHRRESIPTAFHLAAFSGRGRVAHDDNLSTEQSVAFRPPRSLLEPV